MIQPVRPWPPAPEEPPDLLVDETLHEVAMPVCAACLDGKGAECHTPGCVFIWHDTPEFDYEGQTLRELIAGQGSVDGVVVPLPEDE